MSANQELSNPSASGDREQAASGAEGGLAHVHAAAALIPLIVRNARDLIAILDTGGRRIYNSPSYAPLLGEPEELAGSDSFDDVHPEDRERVREIFQDTVRTGTGHRTEYRLMARDGTVRVIQSEGSAIRDDAERVTGVVVVGRDVTEERRAAAQLDAALRRQKALAEFSLFSLREPEHMRVIERAAALVAEVLEVDFGTALELEPDGKAFRVVAGHNWPQHRLGARISAGGDTQAGHALALYRRSGAKALEAPQPVAIEDLKADGRFGNSFRVRELGVVSTVCVVIPAAERPFGTLTAHSRTRRRFEPVETEFMQAVANVLSAALDRCRSHAALQESEDRYRDLVEHSQDLICTHYLDGRIGSVNPWAAKVLGYEPAELLNMNVRDVLAPKRRPEFDGYIDRLKKDGVASGLMVVQTRTGEKRLWKYANSLRTEGVPVPIVRGMAHDVTKQMRAEAALRKSEERFRSLTELSSDWYWEQDAELRFSSVSEGFFQKSGMLSEDVLGRRRWELSGASSPGASWDAHRAMLEARLPFRDFEFERVAADGTKHYQTISGEPVFDAEGRFTGYRGTGRDVTERKLAEQALAEREELLRATFDHAPVGISLYDPSGRFIKANRALQSMLGYSENELRRMTLADLVHPEERSESRRLREELIAGKRTRIVSNRRYLRKDGGFLSARITVSAVHGEDGSVRYTVGLIEDVTEQLRAEAKLREMSENLAASEAQLRAFMDHSPVSMFIKDREGRYRHVNAQFLRNFGLTADNVLGRTAAEIFPREQAEAFLNHDARVRATRAPIMDEGSVLFVDGVHATLANKFPILDDTGEIAAIGGVVADITDRKRMEQALRENRRLLARAQEIAGLGYWEYDLAAGVTKGSRELRRMLGVPDGLPPQTLEWSLSMIHADDRERVRTVMKRSVEQGSSYELETRVVTPASGERIMLIAGEAVKDDAGRITKLIGTCLDITEQRRREEELCNAAEELQVLSRRLVDAQETERRRLAAELHDRVGQNLTALSINLDILAGRMTAPDADAARRLRDSLDLLDATALCVEGVLDDLRPPMLDDWGLGPTLRWVGDEFSRRTETPVRVQVLGTERRIDSPTEIALLRIVQEALNNIAKHAGARQVEITLGWEQDAVRVEVADDGLGFEHTEFRGGRGLGIVTMRERVQAANGRLNIDSAPGKGTRVRALIPR